MEEVHRELLRRAQEAVAEATRTQQRASELSAFVSALRATTPAALVRCAWCERVAAGEHWIDPYSLLQANLRERLRKNASHGICPTCFERAIAAAEQERDQRRASHRGGRDSS
jgi:hypothetical protein